MDPLGIIGIAIGVGAWVYTIVSSKTLAAQLKQIQRGVADIFDTICKSDALSKASQRPSLPNPATSAGTPRQQLQQEQAELARAAGELMEQMSISQGDMGSMPGVFAVAREKAKQSQCMSHLKQLGLAAMMYVQDHDEQFPDAKQWCDELNLYFDGDNRILSCPTDGSEYSYAMNTNLSEANLNNISERHRTVLLFDSNAKSKNAHDTGESLPSPGRHLERNAVLFADGHVEILDAAKVDALKWSAT